MQQIIFTPTSSSEISTLPKVLQLEVLANLDKLNPETLEKNPQHFGRVQRGARILYRCHGGDYRIYFEKKSEGLVIHRILHKNTLKDFLFRSKIGVYEEDSLEQHPKFWTLIDEPAQHLEAI